MRPISPSPVQVLAEQRRRQWLRLVLVALVLLMAVAVGVSLVAIESDLERRVREELEADGQVGMRVSFAGQDATVVCGVPTDDPVALVALIEAVRGVREAHLDASCGRSLGQPRIGADPPASITPGSVATSTDPAVIDQLSEEAVTTTTAVGSLAPGVPGVPPTSQVGQDGEDAARELSLRVTAELADGRIVLSGTVPDTAARDVLVAAAETSTAPANVVDELVIDPDSAIGVGDLDATLDRLATLLATVSSDLVSGTVRLERGDLSLTGVAATEVQRAALETAAEEAGAAIAVTDRPVAAASEADQLADLLNRIVQEGPILFESASAVLTADTEAVLDQVAAVAERYSGVAIQVIGHTDSRGNAATNLLLSRERARAVRDALVTRGVTAPITSTGRGERTPVLVGGIEDADASRRVEFVVEADES